VGNPIRGKGTPEDPDRRPFDRPGSVTAGRFGPLSSVRVSLYSARKQEPGLGFFAAPTPPGLDFNSQMVDPAPAATDDPGGGPPRRGRGASHSVASVGGTQAKRGRRLAVFCDPGTGFEAGGTKTAEERPARVPRRWGGDSTRGPVLGSRPTANFTKYDTGPAGKYPQWQVSTSRPIRLART